MSEEMRNITIRCSHCNIVIGTTGELDKAILKVIASNAYKIGFMLYNSNLRGFGEFTSGISEAVLQCKLDKAEVRKMDNSLQGLLCLHQ